MHKKQPNFVFTNNKTPVPCPFIDCLFFQSSQLACVKHVLGKHYRTWVVCGICKRDPVEELASKVHDGHTLKEHLKVCGIVKGSATRAAKGMKRKVSSMEDADAGEEGQRVSPSPLSDADA